MYNVVIVIILQCLWVSGQAVFQDSTKRPDQRRQNVNDVRGHAGDVEVTLDAGYRSRVSTGNNIAKGTLSRVLYGATGPGKRNGINSNKVDNASFAVKDFLELFRIKAILDFINYYSRFNRNFALQNQLKTSLRGTPESDTFTGKNHNGNNLQSNRLNSLLRNVAAAAHNLKVQDGK